MNPLSIIIPSKTDANLGACVRAIRAAGELVTADAGDLMHATIHKGNTSPRKMGSAWTAI